MHNRTGQVDPRRTEGGVIGFVSRTFWYGGAEGGCEVDGKRVRRTVRGVRAWGKSFVSVDV